MRFVKTVRIEQITKKAVSAGCFFGKMQQTFAMAFELHFRAEVTIFLLVLYN